MPRAIWSGAITFGLVNAPVKMYSAIDEHDLELHLVHEKDGSRIGYEKVCKKEGKPVSADEIVKAYEVSDGDLVFLTAEDFEAAGEEGYRTIEVPDFVPHDEIDPIVFQRTYFLGPAEGAEKVYALLVRAMDESALSAIARYVFHDRQQLGCLRIREGVITLENMYFADEIRPVDGIAPKGQASTKKELEMAESLIDRFTSRSSTSTATSTPTGFSPSSREAEGRRGARGGERRAGGAGRPVRGAACERRVREVEVEERALEAEEHDAAQAARTQQGEDLGHRREDGVPGELRRHHSELDALELLVLDLTRRHCEEHVAVHQRVERLDRARHRRVHLPPEGAEQPRIQRLVRDDDGERRVPRRRHDRHAGREPLLDAGDERVPLSRRRVEVAADDRSVAVDDGADRVHDREDRDPRLSDLTEGAALARGLDAPRSRRSSPPSPTARRRVARAGTTRAAPPSAQLVRAPCPGRPRCRAARSRR